jgi:citrate lyase subunit beta / citryl-CoA lyase
MSGVVAPRRRAVHFVPGGNDRFLAKALASEADTLVLDLEDSVPPDHKPEARGAVVAWLSEARSTGQELMVRVNPLDTPWGGDDVVAVVTAGADSLMIPKTRHLDELVALDELIRSVDPDSEVTLFPVATETPEGVVNLASVATHPRLDGVCWGAEDLSAAIGARTGRDGQGRLLPVFETVRSLCLLAAAASGKQAIDSVWTDLRDRDGLRADCELGAAMGFDGKITIHPDQIPVVNEAFTPTAAEVEEARELLAAAEASAAAGKLAFEFRGQMVDQPHLTRAAKLLARAEPA